MAIYILKEKEKRVMGDILEWAKREVEIACKRENPERKEGEFDYGCACHESALKAFESLCNDEHSGYSIKITQGILNRLINNQPLTPIEDTDDVWEIVWQTDEFDQYQCKRMSSLFKYDYGDGKVKYTDVDRVCCINIHDPSDTYHFGLVSRIIDEMFPITMPYMPDTKPIKVYCEDFLADPKKGDFDTVGILYALKEENGEQQKIEIRRFFRDSIDGEEEGMTEIDKAEYEFRKTVANKKGVINDGSEWRERNFMH